MNKQTKAPAGSSIRIVPALLLAGLSPAAPAEQPPITELAPITVSAHGGSIIPYDSTGVSVTVLDVEELREEGITYLDEAISRVPGVYVQPGGGSNQRGNVSNIAIRGMSSAQLTLPMLDGLRIYDSSAGCNLTPNVLSRTNIFDIGTLEVLRGSQGAVYGNGAVAGVILGAKYGASKMPAHWIEKTRFPTGTCLQFTKGIDIKDFAEKITDIIMEG